VCSHVPPILPKLIRLQYSPFSDIASIISGIFDIFGRIECHLRCRCHRLVLYSFSMNRRAECHLRCHCRVPRGLPLRRRCLLSQLPCQRHARAVTVVLIQRDTYLGYVRGDAPTNLDSGFYHKIMFLTLFLPSFILYILNRPDPDGRGALDARGIPGRGARNGQRRLLVAWQRAGQSEPVQVRARFSIGRFFGTP
jgi:hypothetical protein